MFAVQDESDDFVRNEFGTISTPLFSKVGCFSDEISENHENHQNGQCSFPTLGSGLKIPAKCKDHEKKGGQHSVEDGSK